MKINQETLQFAGWMKASGWWEEALEGAKSCLDEAGYPDYDYSSRWDRDSQKAFEVIAEVLVSINEEVLPFSEAFLNAVNTYEISDQIFEAAQGNEDKDFRARSNHWKLKFLELNENQRKTKSFIDQVISNKRWGKSFFQGVRMVGPWNSVLKHKEPASLTA